MKRKSLTGLLAVGMAAVVFSGCGADVSVGNDNGTETEVVQTEPVSTETEVQQEETTEQEEAQTAWADANGVTFTEGELNILAYSYGKDADGNITEAIEATQQEAVYSEPVIEVSEADADGNVTYTITYTITSEWEGRMDMDTAYAGFGANWSFATYGLLDAYTGICFPSAGFELSGDGDSDGYMLETEVFVNGVSYKVATGKYSEQSLGEWEYDWPSDTEVVSSLAWTTTTTMTVVAPAEYDGLLLCIDGTGATEPANVDEEISEAEPFDMEAFSETIFKNVNYTGSLLN